MSEPESIVFVVDDDPSVRTAIKRLIGCVGLQVELFGSPSVMDTVRSLASVTVVPMSANVSGAPRRRL